MPRHLRSYGLTITRRLLCNWESNPNCFFCREMS
nr:MAG TPA: hypothetical protein [Caudoviricetes sp.]